MKNEHHILIFGILIFAPLIYSQCIINESSTNKCKLCSSQYYPSSYTQNFIYFETDNVTCLQKTKEYLLRKIFIRKTIDKQCPENFDDCYEKIEDAFKNETKTYLDYLKGELNIVFEQGDHYINEKISSSEYFRRFDLIIKISALDFQNEVRIIFNVPLYFFVSNLFEMNGITFEFDLTDDENIPSIYGLINLELLFDKFYEASISKIYFINCKFFGRNLIRTSHFYSLINVGYFGGSVLFEKCYFSNFLIGNGLVKYSSMSFFSTLNIYLNYPSTSDYSEFSLYIQQYSTINLIEVKFSNYNIVLDDQNNCLMNFQRSLGEIIFENVIFNDFSFEIEINLITIESVFNQISLTNIFAKNMRRINFLDCENCEFLIIQNLFMDNIYDFQNHLIRISSSFYLFLENANFFSINAETNIYSSLLYIENTYVLFKNAIFLNNFLGNLIRLYQSNIGLENCKFVSIISIMNIFLSYEVEIFLL